MNERVKIQIYLTPEEAAIWRACAAKEGVALTAWIAGKVQSGRLLGTAMKNLHTKVDRLLEGS